MENQEGFRNQGNQDLKVKDKIAPNILNEINEIQSIKSVEYYIFYIKSEIYRQFYRGLSKIYHCKVQYPLPNL